MLSLSIVSFILLNFRFLTVTSETIKLCGSEFPNNSKFEATQQIFNIYPSCEHAEIKTPTPPPRPSCKTPCGYDQSSQYGIYKIHPETKSWNDARKACVTEGAQLAVFTSMDEIHYIRQSLSQHNVQRVWVGYHDQFVEGDWTTVWGKPMLGDSGIASFWWANQPDNDKGIVNQDCALLDGNGMDDDACHLVMPFICKFTSRDCYDY